ncbi:MAG: terminase small subunit [Clostridium sp.]|nr:MAG: terminase small subunit [Clostridium sp.]
MLTAKEEKFVAGLIKGLSQRQAYKKAFAVKWKDSTIDSKASTLFKSDKVQERYKELLQEVNKRTDEEAIMSAQERLVFFYQKL